MKLFGHRRIKRNEAGEVIGQKESPARAVTKSSLGRNHGPDSGRKLIVSLVDGDLIEFRPSGTRRKYQVEAIAAYEYVLRCKANFALLERARAKKESKQRRLASQRQQRAERKLFGKE